MSEHGPVGVGVDGYTFSDRGVVEGAAGAHEHLLDRFEEEIVSREAAWSVGVDSSGQTDAARAALVADREAREAEHFEFRRNSAKHFLAQQDRFNADREALLERIKELEDGGLCSAESRSGGS